MIRAEFEQVLGFALDEFQNRALDALDAGRSVLVAAPTGSGKTVVAEYAVAKALAEGRKAFYTTPLKALSNQKYGDLVRRHGADQVGLLTGDNAINGDAPVIVMTTEVLRNMIYARSGSLSGLRYVILDEVHYLQNAYRGPVWEEVIIHAPHDVDLVCLSATVSNAEELRDWIQTVRGETDAIIEEKRPVELHHLYLVGDRTHDVLHLMPTIEAGRPNPEVVTLLNRGGRDVGYGRRGRLFTPRRSETIELLHNEDMLPAIYFIFSRAACDDAVRQGLRWGLRLTTPEERAAIREIAEEKVASLSNADLAVLDYPGWLEGLEAGLAAHHAGMVPPFKEAVEACFARALVKAVFATETLSLGINMPARTVVIEKLSKFSGESTQLLTPGEYTQLTGRAGRRGIDNVGYGIVLYSPFVSFERVVASLASNRTYVLQSSFRPTYNMAANLVRRYPPDEAHHLLNLSFAQYRSDTTVVRHVAQLERSRVMAAKYRERAVCDLGDVDEYRELKRRAQRARDLTTRRGGADDVENALARIRLGDVLVLPGASERVAVVATRSRRGGRTQLVGVTKDANKIVLGARDFAVPPRVVGRIELPVPYVDRGKQTAREVAAAVRDVRVADADDATTPSDPRRRALDEAAQAEAIEAERHPVASCPDLKGHESAAERAERHTRDAAELEKKVRRHTESLARQFDRVLQLLEAGGYVDGWALTDAGQRLARTYHECDLLVVESLGAGLLDGLDPPAVAALVSVFTYEARSAAPPVAPWFPTPELRRRWIEIEHLAAQLNSAEEELGLPATRMPDAGFVPAAYAWAAGHPFHQVVGEEEMSGGDFVRNVKQLIDLLRQVGEVAPEEGTRRAAGKAAEALFRGVVAASSVIGAASAAPEIVLAEDTGAERAGDGDAERAADPVATSATGSARPGEGGAAADA